MPGNGLEVNNDIDVVVSLILDIGFGWIIILGYPKLRYSVGTLGNYQLTSPTMSANFGLPG